MLKLKYYYVPSELTKNKNHSIDAVLLRKLYFQQNCTVIRVSLYLHIQYM